MAKSFNLKSLILHLLVWLLIINLTYLITGNFFFRFNIVHSLLIWVIYLTIFYTNYFILIPYLLFNKKILAYIGFSIILLAVSYFLKDSLIRMNFEELPNFRNINGPPPPEILANKMPFQRPNPEGFFNIRNYKPIIFTLTGIIFFYIISLLLKLLQKWNNHEKYKAELEKEKILIELKLLKQQLHPHFLFNSLNNIYSLSISKSDKVTSSILKLSSILRYFLYENVDTMIYLKDEISVINDYIELQKLRINDTVTLSYNAIGDFSNYKIEPFIILPLIENSFKYGSDNINSSFIDFAIIVMHNKLGLRIKNKIVYKPQSKDHNSGIGIKNIKRRLELLYPGKYIFDIKESDGIFSVHLELKLKR